MLSSNPDPLYMAHGYIHSPQTKAKAALLILQLLDPSLAQTLMHLSNDVAALWKELCTRFERDTEATKLSLFTELMNEKLKGDENIDQYTGRLMTLFRRLETLGEVTSLTKRKYHLLTGLTEDYTAMVDSLNLQPQLSFEEIIRHLKDKNDKLRNKHITAEQDLEKETARLSRNTPHSSPQQNPQRATAVQNPEEAAHYGEGSYTRRGRGGSYRGRGNHSTYPSRNSGNRYHPYSSEAEGSGNSNVYPHRRGRSSLRGRGRGKRRGNWRGRGSSRRGFGSDQSSREQQESSNSNQGHQQQSRVNDYRCHNCGKRGHFIAQCTANVNRF